MTEPAHPYSVENLQRHLRLTSVNDLAVKLELNRPEIMLFKREGLARWRAKEFAERCGAIPSEVWPGWDKNPADEPDEKPPAPRKIVWENPPPTRRRRGAKSLADYLKSLDLPFEELKSNPGQWARVADFPRYNRGWAAATLVNGKPASKSGSTPAVEPLFGRGWEAVGHTEASTHPTTEDEKGKTSYLYMRWVG